MRAGSRIPGDHQRGAIGWLGGVVRAELGAGDLREALFAPPQAAIGWPEKRARPAGQGDCGGALAALSPPRRVRRFSNSSGAKCGHNRITQQLEHQMAVARQELAAHLDRLLTRLGVEEPARAFRHRQG
jgi:hypothetical protein